MQHGVIAQDRDGTLQKSVISLRMDLTDSQSLALCIPFFTSCDAIEFSEIGHWWQEPCDLPVRLLSVLHTVQLKHIKSIELQLLSGVLSSFGLTFQ